MNEQHITDILDNISFGALSDSELTVIRAHSAECADCLAAFQAARMSAAIFRFEADENAPGPSQFFQTKVMAALREQRSQRESKRSIWDFRRIWQASGPLVSFMVLLVFGLMFASVWAPTTHGDTAAFAYEEAVIFEQDTAFNDIANEQAFPVIFER